MQDDAIRDLLAEVAHGYMGLPAGHVAAPFGHVEAHGGDLEAVPTAGMIADNGHRLNRRDVEAFTVMVREISDAIRRKGPVS